MSREAMQMALEALDSDNPDIQLRAAIALRQALEADGGNCYGDGTVYRGQRSKDSSVTTYTAKLKEKNHD